MGQDQAAGIRLGERQQVDPGVIAAELGECARDESLVNPADHLRVPSGHVQQGAPAQQHHRIAGGLQRGEPEVLEDAQDLAPCGDGRAEALENLLRRHIDKEENGIFPAAAVALDGAAWDRIEARDRGSSG